MNFDKMERLLTEEIARGEELLENMTRSEMDSSLNDLTHEDELTRADAFINKGNRTRIMSAKAAELRNLKAALARVRMRDPDFGYCEECGEEIPIKRLIAIPGTIYCVHCAEAMQSGKSGNPSLDDDFQIAEPA